MKVGDCVLIVKSVFANKVGKVGILREIDYQRDYPYIVECGTTSPFQREDLEPLTLEQVVDRANQEA